MSVNTVEKPVTAGKGCKMQDTISDNDKGLRVPGERREGERREISMRRGDLRWDPLRKERRLGYDRRIISEPATNVPPAVGS